MVDPFADEGAALAATAPDSAEFLAEVKAEEVGKGAEIFTCCGISKLQGAKLSETISKTESQES